MPKVNRLKRLAESEIRDMLRSASAYQKLDNMEQRQLYTELSTTRYNQLQAENYRTSQKAFHTFLKTSNLPDFVNTHIKAVFEATLDVSIEQMKAYQDLLESSTKTVDRFVRENRKEDNDEQISKTGSWKAVAKPAGRRLKKKDD